MAEKQQNGQGQKKGSHKSGKSLPPGRQFRWKDLPRRANEFGHGSTLTKKNREVQARMVAHELKTLCGVSRPADLRRSHVAKLVAAWNDPQQPQWNISPGTQAERLSALRAGLAWMKLNLDGEICGRVGEAGVNTELGVPLRSRDGKRDALPYAEFRARLDEMTAKTKGSRHILKNAYMRAVAELQYALGLRPEEALMIDLKPITKALKQNRKDVPIIEGTKGGRLRDVSILDDDHHLEVEKAVAVAIQLQGKRKWLPPSKTLEAAKKQYQRFWTALGFECREITSYSARYAHAERSYQDRLSQGEHPREALARGANDFGHGAGRTDFMRNVYLKQFFRKKK